MKGKDILCGSQAATAICSMDEGSSSSTIHLGRAIDRYNPIIRDSTRTPKSLPTLPSSPRYINTSTRKANASSLFSKNNDDDMQKRKSISSFITSVVNSHKQSRKGGWGCKNPGDFIRPPGSTRYLLSDINNNITESLLTDLHPNNLLNEEESSVSLPPPPRSPHQVVVLRVSLHCKGCEKKMRKHLSRMQGVTSFDIDFAAKKLTVVGDVTPLSVLSSVSKVKNSQLLAPTISSSNPTTVSSEHSRIQKSNTVAV